MSCSPSPFNSACCGNSDSFRHRAGLTGWHEQSLDTVIRSDMLPAVSGSTPARQADTELVSTRPLGNRYLCRWRMRLRAICVSVRVVGPT